MWFEGVRGEVRGGGAERGGGDDGIGVPNLSEDILFRHWNLDGERMGESGLSWITSGLPRSGSESSSESMRRRIPDLTLPLDGGGGEGGLRGRGVWRIEGGGGRWVSEGEDDDEDEVKGVDREVLVNGWGVRRGFNLLRKLSVCLAALTNSPSPPLPTSSLAASGELGDHMSPLAWLCTLTLDSRVGRGPSKPLWICGSERTKPGIWGPSREPNRTPPTLTSF